MPRVHPFPPCLPDGGPGWGTHSVGVQPLSHRAPRPSWFWKPLPLRPKVPKVTLPGCPCHPAMLILCQGSLGHGSGCLLAGREEELRDTHGVQGLEPHEARIRVWALFSAGSPQVTKSGAPVPSLHCRATASQYVAVGHRIAQMEQSPGLRSQSCPGLGDPPLVVGGGKE